MKSSCDSKSYLSLYLKLEPCQKHYVRKEEQNVKFTVVDKYMEYHIDLDWVLIII